jgi:hypothetical protein
MRQVERNGDYLKPDNEREIFLLIHSNDLRKGKRLRT